MKSDLLKIFALCVSSAGLLSAMNLEAKDTVRLEVKRVDRNGAHALEVSGISGHSAYVVKDARVTRTDATAQIEVELEPAGSASPGKSGRFAVTIPDAEKVERVTFGPAKKEIWTAPGHH